MARASVNHGAAQMPSWPATCVVVQTPSGYAASPPMSSTRSERSSKPCSAAKNGTCVVPACVMSGPSPDTAALRMRSCCTSQPTTSVSTLMPVFSANGFSKVSMSFLGSGPLGMIHSRTVWPLRLSVPVAAVLELELESSSSPPQAPTPTASTRAARAHAIHEILRTVFLSSYENGFGGERHCTGPTDLLARDHPLAGAVAVEPRTINSTGSVTG